MTPSQRRLARHALGLPNERNRSYRNRYCSPPAHPSHAEWMAMVAAGEACAVLPPPGRCLPYDHFTLTADGAARALEAGEQLDREDFPASEVAA